MKISILSLVLCVPLVIAGGQTKITGKQSRPRVLSPTDYSRDNGLAESLQADEYWKVLELIHGMCGQR